MANPSQMTPPGASAPPGAWRRRWSALVPWLATAARLVLAGVWLAAGIGKVTDLDGSIRAVHAYQLTPYEVSVIIGAALPWVELVLAALLLAGLATRVAAAVSSLLLTGFVAGIASAWARGLSIDCGCFGGGGELEPGVDPGYHLTLARDAGLLLLAVFLVIYPISKLSVDAWLRAAATTREDHEHAS